MLATGEAELKKMIRTAPGGWLSGPRGAGRARMQQPQVGRRLRQAREQPRAVPKFGANTRLFLRGDDQRKVRTLGDERNLARWRAVPVGEQQMVSAQAPLPSSALRQEVSSQRRAGNGQRAARDRADDLAAMCNSAESLSQISRIAPT